MFAPARLAVGLEPSSVPDVSSLAPIHNVEASVPPLSAHAPIRQTKLSRNTIRPAKKINDKSPPLNIQSSRLPLAADGLTYCATIAAEAAGTASLRNLPPRLR